MTPGSIVVVDWRDALHGSGEPNKTRPAVVVGGADLFHDAFGYLLVVPMTTVASLALHGATLEIAPSPENCCSQRSYALAWNAQTVPIARVRNTRARVTDAQLETLRDQVARLVER
ncbi:MAG: type II toxin-antitoxin system PemK/MazF family toxin [bacterium]|nr:type II toxin-antitoxin system PemK/MazF family toxin [bacterium]